MINPTLIGLGLNISDEEYESTIPTTYTTWDSLLKAAGAAAAYGHLDVLELLLSKIHPGSDRLQSSDLCSTAHQALAAAAEGGHLDVVKFTVEYVKKKDYTQFFLGSKVLGRAIFGDQKAVVEFLLGLEEFEWDLKDAFVEAVDAEDKSLADRIYGLYFQKSTKNDLFTYLACCGFLDALKYLYETQDADFELIGEAFVKTVEWRGNDTLEFLLSTDRVSSEAFEKGFEKAVVASWDRENMVPFLLEKKRASAQSINKAFVAAWSSEMLRILLSCEHIWDESICTVFEKATRGMKENYSTKEGENVRIIKLLCTKDCISSELIGQAFVAAASNGQSELLMLLRDDGRISSQKVGEAFVATATREKSDMMMSLYDKSISPDALLSAFSNAAYRGRIRNVNELVKLLSNQDLVPQEFKHKAFMIAAQLRHDAILGILCGSSKENWPLTMLKEALAVAKHDEVKGLIREIICDQLFDPNTHGLLEIASELMNNRNSGATTSG